ncbi:hypothetical protein Thimo_2069 [Thioflavicoccus mobilis 8321]|uniref:L,D-TPase catalytic domain-containing protein n=2 Tax=Thioflavicoccus mobilis TaxID=80679 RepID=L0GYC4_9GAMM|nr:hypothetical protein Thimo_2069 [Thioflavicoccus mobilis 8321]
MSQSNHSPTPDTAKAPHFALPQALRAALARHRSMHVDIASQTLVLHDGGRPLACYPVSTGVNGPGERDGSGCTPRGWHRVRLAIGAGCPVGTVFRGRRPTGEVYTPELAARFPERDWVLTRILWLTGLEPGRNRGGACDTLRRFIYIHGCPDSEPMGVPRSHGCIRMRNADLFDLFPRVAAGTLVEIRADGDGDA